MDNSKQIVISGKEVIEKTKASIRTVRDQEIILAVDVARIYEHHQKALIGS